MESYVLIGQSNMAGRGFLNEVEAVSNENVFMLRNGKWQPMVEPIHFERPTAGVGLSSSFAGSIVKKYPKRKIGLIPCADGGSSLEEWMIGELLFDHAVFQCQLAKRTSTIKAILWHQGESDCKEEQIACYKEKFTTMINTFRELLDIKDVPLIIGGIGDFVPKTTILTDMDNYTKINDILFQYCRENKNSYFVTAKGLPSNPDMLHFSAKALRVFGIRYFNAYENNEHITKPLEDENDFNKYFDYMNKDEECHAPIDIKML